MFLYHILFVSIIVKTMYIPYSHVNLRRPALLNDEYKAITLSWKPILSDV